MTFDEIIKVLNRKKKNMTEADHLAIWKDLYEKKYGSCSVIQEQIADAATMVIASAGVASTVYWHGILCLAKGLAKTKLPMNYIWDEVCERVNKMKKGE